MAFFYFFDTISISRVDEVARSDTMALDSPVENGEGDDNG